MFLRALLAFIALPGVVAFLVPLLLAWAVLAAPSFSVIGLAPLLAGVGLLLWCVRNFYVDGRGTLGPWQPPRDLVIVGPYRLSRNPMYIAVSLVLLGWALAFRSWVHLLYAAGVMVAFHVRVVSMEEPWLAQTHRDEWRRYAARTPRWIFRSRRGLAASIVAVFVALLIAGLVYEAIEDARAAEDFPRPGMLVDVGGRRLHLLCIGDGEPLVVFESSGWGNALSASAARERIGSRTRVCSYDRRGQGWSDPAPGAATVGALVNDLGVLQDRARLPSPMILVASSIGGLNAELFARRYPERVAGLVLLDAANSLTIPVLASRSRSLTASACTAGALATFGVMRLVDPLRIGKESEESRRASALTYNARSWQQTCAMARGLDGTRREFDEAPRWKADLPLIVLSASSAEGLLPPGLARTAEEIWPAFVESQRELAKRSTRGRWRMVPDSTHLIGESQPDAVVDAVVELIENRSG
jgi:pimeloyl-ACP methyl ester carboxylesterase/protein-S-isoprenylcysteine O-methyltransferase Ste14